MTLRYHRYLRPDGPDHSLAPPASAFAVRVDGFPVAVTQTRINGEFLQLRLDATVGHRVRQVTVSYTPPSTNPVQSIQGGLAAALTDIPVDINIRPSGPGTGGRTAGSCSTR